MSVNKTKVLVLGQTGMLGHIVKRLLEADPRLAVFGTQMDSRARPLYFDVLKNKQGLRRIFDKYRGFDYCINCIGITANRINEGDVSSIRKAHLINAVFPGQLARLAKQHNCKVIQISTDGVFRGTKTSYDENSRPDCRDIYGKTKMAGEINADNFLNIRCSIIGPSPYEHAGLWEWFNGLPAGSNAHGFTNHIWNGVTTLQFAQLCRAIITGDHFQALRSQSGIYHFVPNKPLSKYALLNAFKQALKKKITIKKSIQGKAKVSRILRSRFSGLRRLLPHGLSIRQAINELLIYERKENG